MQLVKYEAACRALAEAKSVDEVKEISGVAEAARAYARQVKNKSLELDALEIRTRAERRLGEIIIGLRRDGLFGQGRGGRVITLKDLAIDADISGPAQRLAKLPLDRFEGEMRDWRSATEVSSRIEVPLQRYRIPSIKGDRQRRATKNGRAPVEVDAPLDRFRAPDGRKICDWRCGELDRIEQLAMRVCAAVRTLRLNMPVANPDPLDTMEMVFKAPQLVELLEAVWSKPVDCGDAGLNRARIDKSRTERTRQCERCKSQFVMNARRNSAGRFCSRECATAARQN